MASGVRKRKLKSKNKVKKEPRDRPLFYYKCECGLVDMLVVEC